MFDPDEFYLSLLLVDARPFHPDWAAGSSDTVSHGSLLWLDNRHIGGEGEGGHMVFTGGCLYLFTSSRSSTSLFCLTWLTAECFWGEFHWAGAHKGSSLLGFFLPFIELQEFSLTATPADLTKLGHTGLKSQSGISSTPQSLIVRNKPNWTNIWSICCKMEMIVFNINAKWSWLKVSTCQVFLFSYFSTPCQTSVL